MQHTPKFIHVAVGGKDGTIVGLTADGLAYRWTTRYDERTRINVQCWVLMANTD